MSEEKRDFALGVKDKLFRNGLFTIPKKENEKPLLIGQRCTRCGKSYFPPASVCPKCLGGDKIEKILLGPYGKLFTFSIVRQGPPQYAEVTPYAIGYVDLEENIRVFSQILTDTFDELEIGMKVEMVLSKLYTDKDGMNVIGYKFKKRKEE